MITTEQLDNMKLVTDETVFLSNDKVLDRLELAVQQGIGGWGVRTDDGVILSLARNLKLALGLAEGSQDLSNKFDETFKKLKGLQMENGRLKKRLSNTEEKLTAALAQLEEALGVDIPEEIE